MTADHSSRPSVLRRADSKMEKSRPEPVADTVPGASWNLWRDAPRIAVIGIFVLLLGAFLYAARTLIAPIVAAACVSITFDLWRCERPNTRPPAVTLGVGLVIMVTWNDLLAGAGGLEYRMPEFVAALKRRRCFGAPARNLARAADVVAAALGTPVEPVRFELPAKEVIAQVVNFLTPAVSELRGLLRQPVLFPVVRNSQRQICAHVR
jgi:hypothetical protein